jgi:hypothetical protein
MTAIAGRHSYHNLISQTTLPPVMEAHLNKTSEKKRERSSSDLELFDTQKLDMERARSKSYLPKLTQKKSTPSSPLTSTRSTIAKLRHDIDNEFRREYHSSLLKDSREFAAKLSHIQTADSERRPLAPIFYQSNQFTPHGNILFNTEKPSYVNSESPYSSSENIAHKEKQESIEKRIGEHDWIPSSPTKAKKDISRDIFLMYEEKQADKDKIANNLKHFNEKLRKQRYTTKSPVSEYY